jgi:IMP cyclohydrolase
MATRAEVLKIDADHRLDTYNRFWNPGDGFVMGLSEDGKFLIQVSWMMGLDEDSRNQIYVDMGKGVLATTPNVYNPMLEKFEKSEIDSNVMIKGKYAVSNGLQTKELIKLNVGDTEDFISNWSYVPIAPNFTPRINGLLTLGIATDEKESNSYYEATYSIVRKSDFDDKHKNAFFIYESFEPGYGYCMTTYARPEGEMALMNQDKKPLVSFSGEPYLMKLPGSPGDIMYAYWSALHPDNRISVAVKAINLQTGKSYFQVKNKHEKFGML